ncbi:MAG: thrombospondin type 3 repeat-containing protein [Planctomycetes bacterium]|nr:thrombospondin type 3 repeat-containing protein [Planctomycetota bacterium]
MRKLLVIVILLTYSVGYAVDCDEYTDFRIGNCTVFVNVPMPNVGRYEGCGYQGTAFWLSDKAAMNAALAEAIRFARENNPGAEECSALMYKDSDNDGVSDFDEIMNGTDPNDPNSKPTPPVVDPGGGGNTGTDPGDGGGTNPGSGTGGDDGGGTGTGGGTGGDAGGGRRGGGGGGTGGRTGGGSTGGGSDDGDGDGSGGSGIDPGDGSGTGGTGDGDGGSGDGDGGTGTGGTGGDGDDDGGLPSDPSNKPGGNPMDPDSNIFVELFNYLLNSLGAFKSDVNKQSAEEKRLLEEMIVSVRLLSEKEFAAQYPEEFKEIEKAIRDAGKENVEAEERAGEKVSESVKSGSEAVKQQLESLTTVAKEGQSKFEQDLADNRAILKDGLAGILGNTGTAADAIYEISDLVQALKDKPQFTDNKILSKMDSMLYELSQKKDVIVEGHTLNADLSTVEKSLRDVVNAINNGGDINWPWSNCEQ